MNSNHYSLVLQDQDDPRHVVDDVEARPARKRAPAHRRGALGTHWIAALLPTLAMIIGLYAYREDVVTSVLSSSHPLLVYIILVALVLGTLMAYRVLLIATREYRRMAACLDHAEGSGSGAARSPRLSAHASVYALLADTPTQAGRAELGRRLSEAQRTIDGQLTLPGYVAGSLVGIGLVGTFVGLLGALRELGGMFSGMMGGAGDATGSPAEMFTSMLMKLQAPMQSMGTAFVASLYGVLGSLVLGVVLVIIGRAVVSLLGEIRERAFAHFDARLEAVTASLALPASEPQALDAEEFGRRQTALLQLIEASTADTIRLRQATTAIAEKADAALALFQGRAEQDAQMHRFMSTGAHWMRAWADISESLQALRTELSREDRQLTRSWEYFGSAVDSLRSEIHSLSTISERWHDDATQRADAMQASSRVVLQVATERIESVMAGVAAANGQDTRHTADALQDCRASFDRLSGRLDTLLAYWIEQEQSRAHPHFTQQR